MKKYSVLVIFLIMGLAVNANATQIGMQDYDGYTEYLFTGNDSASIVAGLLGVSTDDLVLAKVEPSEFEAGGEYGTDTLFDLTVDLADNSTSCGTWESAVPLSAFALKASDYVMITILDTPATSGSWSLESMWALLAANVEKWPNGGGQYPALSHFSGYTTAPVPEPATLLLLGTGLVGLAGFGKKKFLNN